MHLVIKFLILPIQIILVLTCFAIAISLLTSVFLWALSTEAVNPRIENHVPKEISGTDHVKIVDSIR